MGFQNVEDFGGESVSGNGYGICSHEFTDWQLEEMRMSLEMPAKVTVGKDAEEKSLWVNNLRGACSNLSHGVQNFTDGNFRRNDRHLFDSAHDLLDFEKQGAAKAAPRMEPSKVFFLKATRLEEDHGESVTEYQHHGSTGGGGQIERTGFLADSDIQMDIAVIC